MMENPSDHRRTDKRFCFIVPSLVVFFASEKFLFFGGERVVIGCKFYKNCVWLYKNVTYGTKANSTKLSCVYG